MSESNAADSLTQLSPVDQYLTFGIGDEDYGIRILSVQEIRGWETVAFACDFWQFTQQLLVDMLLFLSFFTCARPNPFIDRLSEVSSPHPFLTDYRGVNTVLFQSLRDE